ncbi:MAG: protein kinase [Acidobacteria bacterium]|nr:protein kinase [Acidobacteriota bacterium]
MNRVGRYQLLEKLGEGGMGVVYKAYDPLIQRVVAVKLIGAARTDDPILRERFFAEARAAGRLSHRNIVTVYDLGEEGGQPFFAMEFLEGRDLARLIRSREPIALARKIDLMAQAARGLAYAHAREVVHRDVKPANIFVTVNGDVKVLDFGLARLARPIASALTRTKPFLGTVGYMAPEQVRGELADTRTDLFAFGVVFYELLSGGRPAFETDSFASTLHRILTEAPEPLANLDQSLPPEMIRIVERALAKSRDDRYQRVDDLLADLTAFRATLSGAGTPMLAPGDPHASQAPAGAEPAGIDSLAVTVGPEAAVETRTPAPRTPPTPWPRAQTTPAPETPAPAFAAGTARRRKGRVWIASALTAAGLLGAGVFRGAGLSQWWRQPVPAVSEAGRPAGTAGAARDSLRPSLLPADPGPEAAPVGDGRGAATGRREEPPEPKGGDNAPKGGELAGAQRTRGRAESDAREEPRRQEEPAPVATLAATVAAQPALVSELPAPPAPVAPPGIPGTPGAASTSSPGTSTPAAASTPEAGASGTPPDAGDAEPRSGLPGIAGTAAAAREEISALLSRYVSALEGRSLVGLKRVWPSLTGTQEQAIAEEFRHARAISVGLSEPAIEVSGATARAACRRTYRLETQDGQRLETGTNTVFMLRRAADGWVIDHVRHETAR